MTELPLSAVSTDGHTALVDAHVHIHSCFELGPFFTAAARNFAAVAARLDLERDYSMQLCLTETCRADGFESLHALVGKTIGDWRVLASPEKESVVVQNDQFGRISIIAGRQIVTDERLEVLALGLAARRPDGGSMVSVIDEVSSTGAIPVLPWGFGKWLGGRGRALRMAIEARNDRTLFLGDNSGRLGGLPEPREFKIARGLRMRILPGTDPLPFRSERDRAGSFGFVCSKEPDDDKPWASLRDALLKPGSSIIPYGRLETPWRFMRNQLAMQYQVRSGRGAA